MDRGLSPREPSDSASHYQMSSISDNTERPCSATFGSERPSGPILPVVFCRQRRVAPSMLPVSLDNVLVYVNAG